MKPAMIILGAAAIALAGCSGGSQPPADEKGPDAAATTPPSKPNPWSKDEVIEAAKSASGAPAGEEKAKAPEKAPE